MENRLVLDKLRQPPADVPPDELFRALLRSPWAVSGISFRLQAAPDVRLSVKALRSSEWSSVGDSLRGIGESEIRDSKRFTQFIYLALLADGEKAFDSPAQILQLDRGQHRRLGLSVVFGLASCSPTYVFSDVAAWDKKLRLGAAHPTNFTDSMLLYGSTDTSSSAVHGRPERYFGVRAGELTDGQFMAFAAARNVMKRHFDNDQA